MPWVDRHTKALIQLWTRCRDRQSLPEPGGVADQPESVMQAFDWIDAEIAQFKKQQAEQERREIASQEASRRLAGGY